MPSVVENLPSRARGNKMSNLTRTKVTAKKLKLALFVSRSDADYVLEVVADGMLGAGMSKKAALPSLRVATKRLLRLAADDISLKVSSKLLDAEASEIAKKVLDRVEVKDADAVPPVNKRRGLPAAVAAA